MYFCWRKRLLTLHCLPLEGVPSQNRFCESFMIEIAKDVDYNDRNDSVQKCLKKTHILIPSFEEHLGGANVEVRKLPICAPESAPPNRCHGGV